MEGHVIGRKHLAAGAGVVLSLALSGTALAQDASVSVVAGGLNNPRGVDVGSNGAVYVAEAGTGSPGSGAIVRYSHGRLSTVLGGLPSGSAGEGDVTGPTNVAARGNGLVKYVVGAGPQGFDVVARVQPNRVLADVQAYRNAHPKPACDPQANPVTWCDLDDPANATDSNAYGLALVGGGELVTDAAGDQLLLVHANGRVESVAKFPNEIVSTSHIPGFPAPAIPAEPVPTTVTVGPDGYWYVGELKGFPFTPGASRIWRIAPWARNITCDASATTGPCTVYADGFTNVTGIDFAPDGTLYVVEIAKNGLVSGDPTGALIRYRNGTQTEIAAGALTMPDDVAVANNHTLYVSNKSVVSGGGELLRISLGS
jgi:hypothetical protein